jgi:hypothetical protein
VSHHWYFKKLWIINERIRKGYTVKEDGTPKGITRIFQVSNLMDMLNMLRSNYFGENLIDWNSLNSAEEKYFKDYFSAFKQPIQYGLIMLDYLLGYKEGNSGEREYSTEFFEWISNPLEPEKTVYKQIENYKMKYDCLQKIDTGTLSKQWAEEIKENRGPLQKMWFYPITAFNNTFIDDLRNKGVRLIDYYWHISRGADPINTPYLFLSSINNFLYLQLQQALFSLENILKFLDKSMKQMEFFKSFDDFQAFMGSEYIVLLQKYGWRAVVKKDKDAGSAFSYYIWERFYFNEENRYLFRLLDKIQKLYHACAYGDSNDTRKMILYSEELQIYLTDRWVKIVANSDDSKKEVLKTMKDRIAEKFKAEILKKSILLPVKEKLKKP